MYALIYANSRSISRLQTDKKPEYIRSKNCHNITARKNLTSSIDGTNRLSVASDITRQYLELHTPDVALVGSANKGSANHLTTIVIIFASVLIILRFINHKVGYSCSCA
jgi:hypothetical protein